MNRLVKELEARYYFDPLKQKFESKAREVGLTEAMNHLTDIMQGSIPEVGLITTNFYEEITNPQQVGMLRFFDFVYIAKAGDWGDRVRNSIGGLSHRLCLCVPLPQGRAASGFASVLRFAPPSGDPTQSQRKSIFPGPHTRR